MLRVSLKLITVFILSVNIVFARVETFTSSAKEIVLEPAVQKKNLSGLTYNPHSDSYFAIINRGDRMYEFNADFKLKRAITITGFDDPEDLSFIAMTPQGPLLAIADEPGIIHLGIIGSGSRVDARNMKQIQLLDESGRTLRLSRNKGIEGITFIPGENVFIVVSEKPAKVWAFKINDQDLSAQVTNYLSRTTESTLTRLVKDLSAVSYNSKTNEIVLLSDESSALIFIDHKSRELRKVIKLETQVQHEGLAFSRNFDAAFIASEPYYLLKVDASNTRRVSR